MNRRAISQISRALGDRFRMASLYGRTAVKAWFHRTPFQDVKRFCMFIGYPRSGHSLVGSLLDAHPRIVISHELDVLKLLDAGYSKYQVLHLILDNSRRFARRGRGWTGYAYEVSGQWQGAFQRLEVIGDKKGGRSTLRLRDDPQLLETLQRTLNYELRFIHVIRNPFDNVATMCAREQEGPELRDNVELYATMCESNLEFKEQVGHERVADLKLETLIEAPQQSLADLCRFLGEEPTDDYLDACAQIVAPSPKQTRHKVPWTPECRAQIEQLIETYPFLHGYTFDA